MWHFCFPKRLGAARWAFVSWISLSGEKNIENEFSGASNSFLHEEQLVLVSRVTLLV